MNGSNSQIDLVPPEVKRNLSRDEMNLAEFPLAVLSTRTDPNIKTLEFADTVKGRNGEVVNRKWIITGADKFGLPTASDDEVLLGLLKLTSESQFTDRKIYFTRYELLRVLKWTTEGRSYTRLQKALDRLSGVRIKTTNGFYDNESKLHSTRNFGIIDAYEINDGRGVGVAVQTKPSFFIWSETIFKSFQSGFIKKLDLNFLLELQSAVSKRLYRYLDKHFWYKAKVQHNLFTLCHEKLGISRNYSYASQLKQQLDPAIEELIKRGFLLGCEFTGKGSATEVTFYAASGARKDTKKEPEILQKITNKIVNSTLGNSGSEHSYEGDLKAVIGELLIQRGIRENQLVKLINNFDEKLLIRVRRIIAYYDELIATNSARVSKSPVGFLYRAVENPAAFILPGDKLDRPEQPQLPIVDNNQRSINATAKKAQKSQDCKVSELEIIYLSERKLELQKLRTVVEPEMLTKMKVEVETALVKVKGLISPDKFEDAVSHGVDERLSKLFALPGFEEWKKLRNKSKEVKPKQAA